jgi:hypothetical protein
MSQTAYVTFPIAIFRSGFQNIKAAVNDAIDYACYAITTKLEEGSDEIKMADAAGYFGISYLDYGAACSAYSNGEDLYESHHGTPMTSISCDILFDYYKNKKTEFQVASLLGFAAVRSILQKKAHCKTNKGHIHARMFGYASVKHMPATLSELQKKYAKRWHMDKVLRELEHNWGLKTFSNHSRGLYIGFDKVDYETLATLNEEKKLKTKEAKLRQIKAGALAAAREKIATGL